MQLTEEQQNAVEGITDHLRNGNGVKSMCGYAGTGKTTLLIEVYKNNPDILFLCPTHKAKGVLFKKLSTVSGEEPPKVQTVTSFLKDYKGTKEECILATIEMLELNEGKYAKEIRKWKKSLERVREQGKAQEPVFADKADADAETILCDEASMIPRTDRNDIELRCRAGVMVGDGFQAAPVVAKHKLDYEDWFFKADHDWSLTKVHRNDAGVLTLATMIREYEDGKFNLVKEISDLKLPDLTILKKSPVILSKAERDTFMFLAFMNKTVDGIAFGARRALKKDADTILPGEKLFASNNFGDVVNKTDLRAIDLIRLHRNEQESIFGKLEEVDTGRIHDTIINPARMLTDITEYERKKRGSNKGLIARYDYARTIHGAQGSEWMNVVYQDNSANMGWMDDTQFNRLIYTAVTRAQKNFAVMT